ncbi:MAG: hypothetical protein IT372_25275 [Polyangiaceae bacterium]|nr:hypothetical protein [Polyangiaceae bacterium]
MKVQREAGALRAELARMERRGRGHRYPPELRTRVVAYAMLRGSGVTPKEVGDELGMDWRTVKRWIEKEDLPGFERIIVHGDAHGPPAGRLVVHGPCGVRIDGLELDALAELLRKLT